MKRILKNPVVCYTVFFFLSLLYLEGVMRLFLHLAGIPVFMLLFSLPAALLFGTICGFLPKLAGRVCGVIFTILLDAGYVAQTVYNHIYGSFASYSQIGMAKQVIGTFGGAALIGVKESVPAILAIFLPLLLLIIGFLIGSYGKMPKEKTTTNWKQVLICAVVFLALQFGTVLFLPLAGKGSYTPYDTYHETFVLDRSVQQFGVLTTLRLEFRTQLFGRKEAVFSQAVIPVIPQLGQPASSVQTASPEPVVSASPEPAATAVPASSSKPTASPEPTATPEPTPTPVPENVYDIDFETLMASTDNAEIQQLDQYFASLTPTTKNAYSGMFEGYNLIILCCESYSPYLVSEELTPMLYKLSHEGFVFKNFYNTICDNTSNSEYVLNMSLLPDVSLYSDGSGEVVNTFTMSKNNTLPFCYGNRLKKEGYRTYAFHNFVGTYYNRDETHTNMGFDFVYMKNGFVYEYSCPTSDRNLVSQAKDFLFTRNEAGEIEPFVSYFLTFSGHMPYNFTPAEHWFTGNDIAIKNQDVVAELPYSDKAKAYLAAQVELEYALEDLMEALEQENLLENTLIVVTGDHYPYALGINTLSEIAGHPLDSEFDKYKGSFILWSGSMEETVEIDTPCCTLDIMPTLYNLLGVDYDSRLLMGTDIFSDGNHMAILMDRSFVTDAVRYNANNGKMQVSEGITLPDGYVEAYNAIIKDKYNASMMMLYNDYYKHLELEEAQE